MANWPKLESLSLNGCRFNTRELAGAVVAACPMLRLFELLEPCGSTFDLVPFLAGLPLTTRSLKIRPPGLYSDWDLPERLGADARVIEVGKLLTSVSVVDGHYVSGYFKDGMRGRLDRFVANLESITHLTLSPIALADLASLARLPKLTNLELARGMYEPLLPVEPSELVALLRESKTLRGVTIDARLAHRWDVYGLQAREDGTPPHIDLIWA